MEKRIERYMKWIIFLLHEHLNHKADRFVHLIFMLIQSYRNIYTHACKLIVLMFNIVYLHCKHKVFFLSFFLGFYFFGGGEKNGNWHKFRETKSASWQWLQFLPRPHSTRFDGLRLPFSSTLNLFSSSKAPNLKQKQ